MVDEIESAFLDEGDEGEETGEPIPPSTWSRPLWRRVTVKHVYAAGALVAIFAALAGDRLLP